jgi:hypothetical protein
MRALALAVTVASAITASLLVAQVSLTTSTDFAVYGIDDYSSTPAEGYGR